MKISTSLKNLCGKSRSVLVAALLCCPILSAMAVEQSLLTIVFHDGNKQSYVLTERPKVTFDATSLFVTGTTVSDTYRIAEVDKFVFDKGNPTDIRDVASGEVRLTFVDGENVLLEGLQPSAVVRLFDISGKSLASLKATADGKASVSLEGGEAGVYVVSISDGRTFKVMKK